MTKKRAGSWEINPVAASELDCFWSKVQKLADEEFGVDDEGDSTVEVNLVDRSRYQSMHYIPVMYSYRGSREAAQAKHAAILNHKIASDQLHLQLDSEHCKEASQ